MMAELSLIAKATLILGVALLATGAARRARASVRSLILAAAFGLVLVLPIASALAPAREVQIPQAYATRFLIAEEIVDQRTDLVGPPHPFASAPTPAPWRLPPPEVLLRTAWLLGTVATLLPLVLGLWRLRDIRRRAHTWPEGRGLIDVLRESVGVRRTVAVVLHDDVAAPMTCGWMRPTIAMPADAPNWPASDVRHALLHELEHVRRQDWPVHILARLTCSLYWFHPVAWIAWRQLSLDSERACDDAVVSQAEHTAYAEQLVSLARRLSKGRAVPLLSMADRRTLSTRIASILSTNTARGRVGTLAAGLVLTGAAALAAAVAPVKAIGAQVRDALTIPTSTDGPTFEVVSVKPNEPDDRLRVNDWQPVTGRLVLRNLTPKVMLTVAYANTATLFLPDERLIGVPDWADKERFTIEAIAGRSVTAAEMQRMLRRVLVDRFGLRVHLEQREQSSYRLVTGRPDRRLGPNLQPAEADKCNASRRPRGGSEAWGPRQLICTTIDLLALDLSERLGRPVLNQTGLTGFYDGTLSYAPSAEELSVIYQLTPSELPPAAQTGPSLTTALQEQLGLKLESTRAAIDVLVVDGLDRPTPNDAPGIQANAQSRGTVISPAASARGQDLRSVAPFLRFAVASVRPSPAGATRDLGGCCAVRYQPGGRMTATNVGVIDLIVSAYRMQYWQVSGGPSWADPDMMVTTDRYNIDAAADGDATADQMRVMLRALLADRFGLVLKPGTQTRRTYDLVVTGGRPKLQLLNVDEYRESVRSGGGRIIAEQMTMSDLARMLGGQVQTVVRDRTGLPGVYKFSVTWTPDSFRLSGVGRPPANGEPGIDPNGPTMFDALRDQLGLRLQETKGPVESVVIQRVERPTPNDAPLPPAPQGATAGRTSSFEVASVRQNKSGSPISRGPIIQPGNRLVAQNTMARVLITTAYGLRHEQIVGGPAWLDTDSWDIEARAREDASLEDVHAMLRTLLAERFGLIARRETRQQDLYALVAAGGTRRTPGRRPAATPCAPLRLPTRLPAVAPDSLVGLDSEPTVTLGKTPKCERRYMPGFIGASQITMPEFAAAVTMFAGRHVVDRTGLKGEFDIDLTFVPGPVAGAMPGDFAPLGTALQEQLGLKLEAARGPVDVLVIDRANRPAGN